MKYVVLISHGEFAQGLHSAVKMMVGDKPELLSTSLKDGESTDDFAVKFRDLIAPMTSDDSVILLCDILGGSPLTTSLALLSEKGLLEKSMIITGMNMPLAMTACIMKDNLDDEMLEQTLLQEGKDGISKFVLESFEDEDDEI